MTSLAIEQQATDIAERAACIGHDIDAHADELDEPGRFLAVKTMQLATQVERLALIVATQAKP